MTKRDAPLSLRITPKLKKRLEDAAKQIKTSKNKLAQDALEAGILAIENHGCLAVPMEFRVEFHVTRIPVPAEDARGISRAGKKGIQRKFVETVQKPKKDKPGDSPPPEGAS